MAQWFGKLLKITAMLRRRGGAAWMTQKQICFSRCTFPLNYEVGTLVQGNATAMRSA